MEISSWDGTVPAPPPLSPQVVIFKLKLIATEREIKKMVN